MCYEHIRSSPDPVALYISFSAPGQVGKGQRCEAQDFSRSLDKESCFAPEFQEILGRH